MKNKKHTPLLAALATLVVLLAGVVLIWLAKVRPDVGKGRSEIVTDFLRAELLQDRKSTRLNSSHSDRSRMPSSA